MRILAAFICMSLIGVVATVLAVVEALIKVLPVILVVSAVFALLWWRRRGCTPAAHSGDGRSAPAVIASCPAQPRALDPRPAGWVLVPVWTPRNVPQPRHYIDAEVIGEVNHHD